MQTPTNVAGLRSGVPFQPVLDRSDEIAGRVGEVRFLQLPTRRFVMVDGDGPPIDGAFATRMPALYGTAWALRFALRDRGLTTRVGPLEGLWWTVGGTFDLERILAGDRTDWRWTLLIVLPDEATDAEVDHALATGRSRVTPEIATSVRAAWFDEGRVAQLLHVGPYAEERPTIEALHHAIAEAGLEPTGRHHEIYLGDPRRAAPERLRTILRQPVR